VALPLIPFVELAPPRVGGVGRVHRVYRDRDRVAVCSAFGLLYWPGRAIYDGHHPRHRVALYVDSRVVAYFDDVRFPIKDVAFHPTQPVMAIAAGAYDGGYFFNGELWWWNWVTNERRSLLGESRDVVRCRFDGDQIAILVMPPNDDEYDHDMRFGAVIDPMAVRATDRDDREIDPRLTDLEAIDPASLGFPPIDREREARESAAELAQLGIAPRSPVWDLAVLADGRIVAAFDDGAVEIFRATGERLVRRELAGKAVQLLPQPDQLLVHATRYVREQSRDDSTLYALRGDELVEWRRFATARACSVDARGRVLARNVERQQAPDQILTADGQVLLETRLGHYDAFNHYLRIDHAPELYFLRGRPKSQHEHKQLCRIDDRQQIHDVCAWDTEDSHLMVGCLALVGGDLVRGYRIYNPHPGEGAKRIERVSPTGEVAWRIEVGAVASALVEWPAAGAVVFALVDTTLGIVDAATGAIHRLEPFVLDGLPTIVTALAVHDETLLVGTIDGRIVMFAVR